MKSKLINKLKKISKEMQLFLKENNNMCVDRTRKNNIFDAILYKLYYTRYASTQQKTVIRLNQFKKNKLKTSRQAISKKENKLSSSFYEKLSNFLADQINANFNFDHKYTRQIIAVDGTFPTLLKSLTNDGYKANKKGESVTPLVSGLFNVTSNYPVTLDLVKTKNERKAFYNFIKNKDKFRGNVFIFDKGYVSEKLFRYMNNNDLLYICRLRDNSCYISNKDNIIINENGMKIRIIKYVINGKSYHMATNVYDYNINLIRQIYHDRWQIEEYFKYIKQNMNLAKINEKRENSIKKLILSQLIVSQIAFIFVNANKGHKNKDKILNKSVLTDGFYDKFLYNFFQNAKFSKYFLLNFIKTHMIYIDTNRGKSVKHTCKRSNFRWYFKKYFKNVKSENI